MQPLQDISYEKKAGIAYVTIERPKAFGAAKPAMLDALRSVMEDARDDTAVHGVLVAGAGDRAFADGADSQTESIPAIDAQACTRSAQSTLDLIEHLGKPVVAAVDGLASGGGCELAMACTSRLATANTRFGQPEARLGIVRGPSATRRLLRLVGRGRALQLILTTDAMDAAEAQRFGLVDEVVESGQLISRAEDMLRRIAGPSEIFKGTP